MEDKIKAILAAKTVPVDYILNDRTDEGFETLPVTKRNICYIVNTVLFDEDEQVLLVQEAKRSCYGQWYLPAGRLEPGETIADGAKREVKEEAGLECELTTLICVELNGTWMRFTFIGNVTGGNLKTLEQKDSESLQAKFFPPDKLPSDIRSSHVRDSKASTSDSGGYVLRCKDILKLIKIGRKFVKERNHPDCLPVVYPHKFITYRFVIVDRPSTSSMQVLVCKKGGNLYIPTIQENVLKTVPLLALVASILNAAFSLRPQECAFNVCGILGIEHRGTGEAEDGVCITHLVNLEMAQDQPTHEITASEDFSWFTVTCPDLNAKLVKGCQRNIVPML